MRATLHPTRGMNNKGLCYFCSNFRKDPKGGMGADYSLTNYFVRTAETTTADLSLIKKFVQREYSNDITVFAKNSTGDIYALDDVSNKIFRCHNNSKTAGWAKGLMIDTQQELIYTTNRYVGRTFTSTLDGAVTAGDNTIDVIDASNFPSAGYAFIKDGLSNSETIQYTGKTENQLTGVTRGEFYSTDRNHASGKEIISFDDDWQDLGAAETYDLRPTIRFGDYNLIGNVNKLAGWKETNFSDWATDLITLPQGYKIVDFSILYYGAEPMLIIAANKGKEGMLFFCTRGDIQEGEYSRYLPINENIKKLHKNFIGLASGIYETDGYALKLVVALPDDEKEIRSADFNIQDIESKGDFLLITANCGQYDRNRTGLWILDLEDRTWYYVLPSNYGVNNLSFGAIFISSVWRIFVSTNYKAGAIDLLASVAKARGNYYQMIYEPSESKIYKLQAVKLNLATKLKSYFNNQDLGFDVIVRYYNFKRPFLQYAHITETSALNQLILDNGLGKPEVGDRIEIITQLGGYPDIAAAPRNVTALDESGGKFTITLDDDLPDTPVTQSQAVLINPLKRIKKISVTDATIDLDDLEFPVEDMPEFKKIMIEVEIRYSNTNASVILNTVELIYTPK